MKIYHKFLLYQNKWIHPYTRIILGGVTYIAYLASILLIMGVVYEHGFTISEHEASQLQTLYRFVWGVSCPSHFAPVIGIQGHKAYF